MGPPFIFQVHGALEETTHFEVDFEEAGLWLDGFLDTTCIRIVDFNICLYKTKVLSTIELLGDN